ncbi:hypothetical protein E2C01_017558 [Portunus trituberculatus]|uniref:Uncharacterized protein n=1 Tax=Portunus trituberculatus TaxID=210409 RepID=A0A5B7DTU1_PORTR|nr:hypothetical protein [Portunus trituberculatus]
MAGPCMCQVVTMLFVGRRGVDQLRGSVIATDAKTPALQECRHAWRCGECGRAAHGSVCGDPVADAGYLPPLPDAV